MEITEEEKEEILEVTQGVLENYGNKAENLIPVLQNLQERLGYLPGPAMEGVAEATGIPPVDVYEVTTFYNQFRLNPPGEHEFKVCMGTACYMVGGEITLESFQRKLEINEGETTADRKFSLERVACVGCCSLAPVVVVDGEIEGHVTPTRVDGIMLSYQENGSGAENNGNGPKQASTDEEE